jgi:DNA modification methylase
LTFKSFNTYLESFHEFGNPTEVKKLKQTVPVFINEFWTSKQRQAHSLHEVSYRACFKPQLPRFFIEKFTQKGDTVYDCFMGRGTTLLEAALLGRHVIGCDINPLSSILVSPRLNPPHLAAVEQRLAEINFSAKVLADEELLVFYHPDTLRQIESLRHYILHKKKCDDIDRWIQMVATNRLTGHSKGFFSVYTLPPNQAVTVERQRKINRDRDQKPEPRNVSELILRKSKSLLTDLAADERETLTSIKPKLLIGSSAYTPTIKSGSVSLVITSPPFLDIVNYASDNWLRCWFNGIDETKIPIWMIKKKEDWQAKMTEVFQELYRVLKPNGIIAFEVGEVRGGKIQLEESVIEAAESVGWKAQLVMINQQDFTKTANCWGISNQKKGTNTNRIVMLQK